MEIGAINLKFAARGVIQMLSFCLNWPATFAFDRLSAATKTRRNNYDDLPNMNEALVRTESYDNPGAGEGIRTPERLRETILSRSPLTAWLLPHIDFFCKKYSLIFLIIF